MSFGEKLRILLEEHTMTQKQLAKELNIAPSTVGSYIQNTREPDFDTLKSIAGFFRFPLIIYWTTRQSSGTGRGKKS